MHTDEQWKAISHRAKNTLVADLPSGVTIVLAHPGQTLDRDPKFLKETYGITPDMVTTLEKSREAPRRITEPSGEIMAEGVSLAQVGVSQETHDAALQRIAELEAELDSKGDDGEGDPPPKK